MKAEKEKGITKKEIRSKIQDSLNQAIIQFEKEGPSKKTSKVVKRASKKIANKVKRDLKDVKPKKSKGKAKGKKKLISDKVKAEVVA